MIELNVEDFPKNFEWNNEQFPPLDALTYWHFLKNANHVIEVGCGFSTFLAKQSKVNLIAIDPEPRIKIEQLGYILKCVQDVPVDIFDVLQSNDILFIDSSHKYYEGSDVHHLIHNVIPKLNKGVLVHFHDYFQPDDYPAEWKKHHEMSKWNEQYFVHPLEKQCEVLVVNNTVSKNHSEELLKKYPFVPKNINKNLGAVKGASVWFRI